MVRGIGYMIGQRVVQRYMEENERITSLKERLSDRQQKMFERRFGQEKKALGLAYLLALFGGTHYAYINRWPTQVVFWLTLGGLLGWWIIDMVLMYFIVHAANRKLAFQIIDDVTAG